MDEVAIDTDREIELLRDLDAVADTVGGSIIQKLLKTLKPGGVIGWVLAVPEGARE